MKMHNFLKVTILSISISICMMPRPALANWQFTKWGMTKADLQKAAPIKLKSGDDCPINNSDDPDTAYQIEFSSAFEVGTMKFMACYLFLDGKLHRINLFSRDVDSKSVIQGLSQKYGAPEVNKSLESVGMTVHKWDQSDETIEFLDASRSVVEIPYPYVVWYETKNYSNKSAVKGRL
jgi:hypothetical protein